jgi:hypothetical protein
MSFWKNLLHAITLRPMPLSDNWIHLEERCQTDDKFAPVNLVSVRLKPEKEEMRKYISPKFLESKFNEITDLLTYYCSEEAKQATGFLFIQEEMDSYFGDITINWYAEGTGKRTGLYLKVSDEIDETLELTIKQAVEVILSPLKTRDQVGFTLEYRVGAAHPEWKAPEKFKELTF